MSEMEPVVIESTNLQNIYRLYKKKPKYSGL